MSINYKQQFIDHPDINPYTGRKIKIDGPAYRKLEKEFFPEKFYTPVVDDKYPIDIPEPTNIIKILPLNRIPLSQEEYGIILSPKTNVPKIPLP